MSEELVQRGLKKGGIPFGKFEWYPTYNTTIRQYADAKIINRVDYGEYSRRKPDGLLIDHRNKKDIGVIAAVEYKTPAEFQTDKQKKSAIEQCNTVCQVLGAKIGIVSDNIVTFWINPNHPDPSNEYDDELGKRRSYSHILNEDKQRLQLPFQISNTSSDDTAKMDERTKETYDLIQIILTYTSKTNSTFKKTAEVDPIGLARAVWQDIYVNTGKDPTKCLYNVVELFIFKFLSDLEVLRDPYDFNSLLRLYEQGRTNKEVLEYYSKVSRPEVIRLFPRGADTTTVLNGTIFVDRNGTPVESQANLFKSSIIKYAEYPSSLRNIKKEFKTKLFETFLKQSNDKSRLGQFFTPRKVVRAIVEMADVEAAKFICDPFCGVGGFLLEPLQLYPSLKNQFHPQGRRTVKLLGYDKGSDEDEHRTIILAKANMMIYLSDLIVKNPTMTTKFSEMFNETFWLISDTNLGTFKYVIDKEEDKPDLILSNPPYVRKGSKTLRDEIVSENLVDHYKDSGVGVEGLAMRWIVNNLRKGGKAFVVIPNGILDNLDNKGLRDSILRDCYITVLISLPRKTFFSNTKKTYIIGLSKKTDGSPTQDFPIMTYLVSSIGETLDVNRFEIEENDLEKAKNLYNQFKGSKKAFNVDDPRCKLIPFERFTNEKYWVVEQYWTDEELVSLGIEEPKETLSINDYGVMLRGLEAEIARAGEQVGEIENQIEETDFREVKITDILDINLGKAIYTKKYINEHPGGYPVYSAQTTNEGVIGNIDTYDWDNECLTWSVDGSYPGMVFHRNGKFSMSTHCGMLKIKEEFNDVLDYGYLFNLLNAVLPEYSKGSGNMRLKKTHIENDVGKIRIPVDANGRFDISKQKEFASKFDTIRRIKELLSRQLEKVNDVAVKIQ